MFLSAGDAGIIGGSRNLSVLRKCELDREREVGFWLPDWVSSENNASLFPQTLSNELSPGKANDKELFEVNQFSFQRLQEKCVTEQEHMDSLSRSEREKGAYRCTVCFQCFVQSGTLNRHMKIHKGGCVFKCTICNKSFNRNDNLMRHIRFAHK